MINLAERKKKREQFLITIYELADGHSNRDVFTEHICQKMSIDYGTEATQIGKFLRDNNFISGGDFRWVALTPLGLSEAERIMETTYAEKEYLVLKTIDEISKKNNYTGADPFSLMEQVGFSEYEFDMIISGISEKKLLRNESTGTFLLNSRGMEYLDQYKNSPKNVGGVNNFTINARDVAFQNQTQNSIQNVHQVNITNNPDFDSAVDAVVNLIRESSLSNFKKEDLLTDIERIKNLAQLEPSQELVEHAKSKINYLETAIKGTDLALKLVPYFPQLYAYFEGLIK